MTMTVTDLKTLREDLDLNQTQMADAIGLKLRAYQDVEAGKSPIRKMHILAVERVALAYGAQGKLGSAAFTPVIAGDWFERLKKDAEAFGNTLSE